MKRNFLKKFRKNDKISKISKVDEFLKGRADLRIGTIFPGWPISSQNFFKLRPVLDFPRRGGSD